MSFFAAGFWPRLQLILMSVNVVVPALDGRFFGPVAGLGVTEIVNLNPASEEVESVGPVAGRRSLSAGAVKLDDSCYSRADFAPPPPHFFQLKPFRPIDAIAWLWDMR